MSLSSFNDRRGGGGGGGGRLTSNNFRGGSRGGGQQRADYSIPIRFTKTVKIDPELKTPLQEMPLSEKTKKVLSDKGFETMTPIQSQSYNLVYSGADVVARSRTGTGKTFAFGLPLIERIISMDENEKRKGTLPLILVLEPTRELVIQVAQELGSVCTAHRIRVEAIYGGSSFFSQEKALRSGVHILVATPGRVLDHITRGTVDLSNVQHVVLDEGDTMLEMGFQKDVESILINVKQPGEKSRKKAMSVLESSKDGYSYSDDDDDDDDDDNNDDDIDNDDDFEAFAAKAKTTVGMKTNVNRDVQMLLFSATMPGWICKLTDKHMKTPTFLDAVQEGETRLSASIKHYALRLPFGLSRVEAVMNYAEDLILTKGEGGQTIVFTNTKEEADTLFGSDCFGSVRTQVLHGDISQNTRQTTIKQFRDGQLDVLIATDVAARGLDIAGVDLVLHTAPPNDHDTYVHRSGRTGRAGRNGTSICLCSSSEEGKLRMFENNLNFKFERIGPPSLKDVAEASAVLATKKIENVSKSAIRYMLPRARTLVQEMTNMLHEPQSEESMNDNEPEEMKFTQLDPSSNQMSMNEKYAWFIAKCLAAVSNRKAISSRSLLTGENGYITFQVEAVFKNGTSPDNIRDWQRLFAGVLKRSLNIEEIKVGKISIGRTDYRTPCALIDVPDSLGETILEALEQIKLPQGLSIKQCQVLPYVTPDYSNESSRGRYEGRGGGGGGGGGGRFSNNRSYSPSPKYGNQAEKSWNKSGNKFEGSGFRPRDHLEVSSPPKRVYTPTGRSYEPK